MADDLAAVVAKYVELRDKKAKLKKEQEKALAEYDKAMEAIEGYLKGKLDEANAKSMRTDAGTFFKENKTSVTVANRDTYLKWVQEHGEWDLVDVRAAKANILAWKEAHQDLPPGLNYSAEIQVQVRRS